MPRLVPGKIAQFANFEDLLHPFLLTFECIQMDFQDDHFCFVSDSSGIINLLFFFHTFLLKFSDFSVFDHISWLHVCFTTQKWYHEIIFRKCFRFPDFFPFFSGFSQILHISIVLIIFFDRMIGLLLINDMMKLFSG